MQLIFQNRAFSPLLVLGYLARLFSQPKAAAEDRMATRFENYQEERGRIEVNTFGFLVESDLRQSLVAKGEFVYDAISGATPTGGPPVPGSDSVPLAHMDDIRRAGVLELTQRFGRHAVSPQVAYSDESDYESIGLAVNYRLELNDKNTTLLAGAAHNFDRIRPGNSFLEEPKRKDTVDLITGVTQLLGPTTVLTINFTLSFADGYLSDPYKGVRFEGYPFFEALFPEKRPEDRDRQMGFVSITQFITPANASIDGSYRISNDSFGIISHTVSAEWRQKVGEMIVLAPFARYYRQSAAEFYGISFPGDPSLSMDEVPEHYSSDYRLSFLTSWTYGIIASATFSETLSIEVGYKRYEMEGNDSITSASAYPSANILTLGLSIWF